MHVHEWIRNDKGLVPQSKILVDTWSSEGDSSEQSQFYKDKLL